MEILSGFHCTLFASPISIATPTNMIFSPFQTPVRHDPVHNGGGGVELGRGEHVEDAL